MQKSVSLNFYGVALIFFLFFLCWGRATFANEWRFLDPLTHTSNSKCIGEPKTALCAAETYAAWLIPLTQARLYVVTAVERPFGG
ncbi:MAG: hypothetical protein O3C34_08705, partial [Proteobacteria bacterium]|nr:hypothetical protein [Pseudomonadota bacterium]